MAFGGRDGPSQTSLIISRLQVLASVNDVHSKRPTSLLQASLLLTSHFHRPSSSFKVLASFNDVRNRYYAPEDVPSWAIPPATNGTSPSPAPVMIPDEYNDTLDTLYVIGLGNLSMVGIGIFPLWSRAAWTPFLVPLIYLIVTGAVPQPPARFLQVSLSHVLLLTQVRGGPRGFPRPAAQ